MKSFWLLVERVEREGESVVLAVRKEGEVMFERFEPRAGEDMRGVAYWEAVGERREDGWCVKEEGVVGAEGEIGDSLISSGPRVERRGSARPDEPFLECLFGVDPPDGLSMVLINLMMFSFAWFEGCLR